MKKKYWIERGDNGAYNIFNKEPGEKGNKAFRYQDYWDISSISGDLCPSLFKKFFGLERHLKKCTCKEVWIDIKITDVKEKKK